jgi:lipoic acid synthetase
VGNRLIAQRAQEHENLIMDNAATAAAQRGSAKTGSIPIKVAAAPALSKPDWIRVRVSQSDTFRAVKQVLREQALAAGI